MRCNRTRVHEDLLDDDADRNAEHTKVHLHTAPLASQPPCSLTYASLLRDDMRCNRTRANEDVSSVDGDS